MANMDDILDKEETNADVVTADHNSANNNDDNPIQKWDGNRFVPYASINNGTEPHQQQVPVVSWMSMDHHNDDNDNNNDNSYYSFGRYSAISNVVAVATTTTAEAVKQPPQQRRYNDDYDDYGIVDFVQQQQQQQDNVRTSVATTITNSEIPSSAKRVLLRFGNATEETDKIVATDAPHMNDTGYDVDILSHWNEENQLQQRHDRVNETTHHINPSYQTTGSSRPSIDAADIEQNRSVSLIHKLRQSAFRRKMNSHSNTGAITTGSTTTDQTDQNGTGSPSLSQSFPSVASHENKSTLLSPTSVRDRTTPQSILKRRTYVGSDTTNFNDDLSPRSLVVGRLEDGMLNLRSPSLMNQATNIDDTISASTGIPVTAPKLTALKFHHQSPDSLMISDSSLDGEFDSHCEMISASSIVSDIIPTSTFANNISQTTIEIGASSMAFIQQLRGAAFRRKMNLTRSRDSLINKERQQREHNATMKLQREKIAAQQEEVLVQQRQEKEQDEVRRKIAHQKSQDVPFKALPLPKTTGLHGHGGLAGVPKIEKRPPTVPISPYLGQRRVFRAIEPSNRQVNVGAAVLWTDGFPEPPNVRKTTTATTTTTTNEFKAIPIPKSSSWAGGAGQSGIPKVPKRMVTIPQSPLLGLRRHQNATGSIRTTKMVETRSKIRSNVTKMVHPIVKASVMTTTVAVSTARLHQPYIPYSTHRAEQRAEFEQRRIINEQVRIVREQNEKIQLVKRLRGELERLRIEI